MLRQEFLSLDIRDVGRTDIDGVGNLDEKVLGEGGGEADGVELVLGLAVGHEDRDEGLGDVPRRARGPPGLSEREQCLRARWGAVGECVSLEIWPELLCIVEDHCLLLLTQRIALCGGVGACVDNWSAEWSGVYVVVDHLDDESTRHGVEDFLRVGVGVALGQHNLLNSSRPKQHLRPLQRWRLNETVIEEDPATVDDGDGVTEDWDGTVVYLDLHLVVGGGGDWCGAWGVRGELLDDVLDVFFLGNVGAHGGAGGREGTWGAVGRDRARGGGDRRWDRVAGDGTEGVLLLMVGS